MISSGSLAARMIWKIFPEGSSQSESIRAASACRPRRGRFCASVTSIRGNNAHADALSIIAINAI